MLVRCVMMAIRLVVMVVVMFVCFKSVVMVLFRLLKNVTMVTQHQVMDAVNFVILNQYVVIQLLKRGNSVMMVIL